MSQEKALDVNIDRDSVSLFDDIDSHAVTITVPETLTALELLEEAERACPLPQIEGGKATWIIYIGHEEDRCMGVSAQQWPSPELLIPADATAKSIFSSGPRKMFFRYWTQTNPHKVLDAVKFNKILPSNY